MPQYKYPSELIRRELDASLQRLQANYIDLLYIHWPGRYVPTFGTNQYKIENKREYSEKDFEQVVQAMGELIAEGKVKAWAVSNETSLGVALFCQAADRLGLPRPCAIQNDYSLLERRLENELAETCMHYNVGVVPYGLLAGGTLSGKHPKTTDAQTRHIKYPNFQPRYYSSRSLVAAEKYAALAVEYGLQPAQMAV